MERKITMSKQWTMRALLLLICLALLLTCVAFGVSETASAEPASINRTFILSDANVHRGQQFEVDISIDGNTTGMKGVRLLITYDSSAMTLVGYEAKNPDGTTKNGWIGAFLAAKKDSMGGYASYGGAEKPFVVMWDSNDPLMGDGKILTLTFQSKADAKVDYATKHTAYPIHVEVDTHSTLVDFGTPAAPTVEGGTVTMLYGFYSVTLLDDEGNFYFGKDALEPGVISEIDIRDLVRKAGGTPAKSPDITDKYYTFAFDSWVETQDSNEDHREYSPTYKATPRQFQLEFHSGLLLDDDSILYQDLLSAVEDAELSDELAAALGQYSYQNGKVSLDYLSSIIYDNYKPSNTRHFTFYGWYLDPECTQPVTFTKMPYVNPELEEDNDLDLYGCFKLNADGADVTTTELSFVYTVREDGYVEATLVVDKNFGFNALAFALQYDASKWECIGFKFAEDSFSGERILPDPITEKLTQSEGWMMLGQGDTILNRKFHFYNGAENSFYTGPLMTFLFAIDSETRDQDLTLSLVIEEKKDLTRFVSLDQDWYANAAFADALLSVVRVTVPQAQTGYVYTGETQNFTLLYDAEDAEYFTCSSTLSGKEAGSYEFTLSLVEKENLYITWDDEDQTTDPVVVTFVIDPKVITPPDVVTTSFTFNYEEQYYFGNEFNPTDYTVTNGKKYDAGTYDVVLSLTDKDNTVWVGGSSEDITDTYTFVIAPLAITVPAEDDTDFEWQDGNEIHYNVSETLDYSVTGAKQSDAGHYTVTITLKDENGNTYWTGLSDETKYEPLTYSFDIDKKTITAPIPNPPFGGYIYNGDEQEFVFTEASLVDSAYYDLTEDSADYKQTNVGSYTIKLELLDSDNTQWAEGAVTSFTFTIQKALINPPTIASKTYTGDTLIATLPSDIADQPYACVQNNGGSFAEVGYPVVFEIKEEFRQNYGWIDPDEEGGIRCTRMFYITTSPNRWAVTPSIANRDYKPGTPIAPTKEPKADVGDVQIAYRVKGSPVYLQSAPIDAGTYIAEFTVTGTQNWEALYEEVEFTIFKVKVAIPTERDKTYTYNGKPQTFEFEKAGNTTLYRAEDATQTDAGTYKVTLSLLNTTNYIWENEETGETTLLNQRYDFIIEKAEILVPEETNTKYVYTGEKQIYRFKNNNTIDLSSCIVENDERTNAGEQTVKVSLYDSKNTVWQGRTGDAATAPINYTFKIDPKPLVKPTAKENVVYIYNGKEQTFAFDKKGDTDRYRVTGDKHTNADLYEVVVTILDKQNYVWEGEDASIEDLTFGFEIRKREVSMTSTPAAEYSLTITEEMNGFSHEARPYLNRLNVDRASLLARIASYDKEAASGNIDAAALTEGKCVLASFSITNLARAVGNYRYELTLPAGLNNLLIVSVDDAEQIVRVFETVAVGDDRLQFTSQNIENFVLLGDHTFMQVVDPAYQKSPATCEEPAVYYLSCGCGIKSDETFTDGAPLGHNYDFAHIDWRWSDDHLSCRAVVICLTDDSHIGVFQAEVELLAYQAPGANFSGLSKREASFLYNGVRYSDTLEEILPSKGYTYPYQPEWIWEKGRYTYTAKAVFHPQEADGEDQVVDAIVSFTATDSEITYTAKALFSGKLYETLNEEDIIVIDVPVAYFDFNDDGKTIMTQQSLLPGEYVTFMDAPARTNAAGEETYLFVGWEDEANTLVVKDVNGDFVGYRIGFESVFFTAKWKSFATVSVTVAAADSVEIESVELYLNVHKIESEEEQLANRADYLLTVKADKTFEVSKVPYGNYKLVINCKVNGKAVKISNDLDVDEFIVRKTVSIPSNNLNTLVEGVGSAEGLENAISEEEKNQMDEAVEIVITQIRVQEVADVIKDEMSSALSDETGELVDFYDVTLQKHTKIYTATGTRDLYDMITEADGYQTNIFPISAALRAKIASVNGTSANIFVYKRHSVNGNSTITLLPKVDPNEDGVDLDRECFYIKKVAGEEYIAVRQKTYSVLGFGVSSEPILFANEITALSFPDWIYNGMPQSEQKVSITATKGINRVQYYYAPDIAGVPGEFTETAPVNAGKYWIKAVIPESIGEGYARAERIASFTVKKKLVEKPTEDESSFVYNGEEQTYDIEECDDYDIDGNLQTDAGNYVVRVTLSDKANTEWIEGGNEDVTFDFVIAKKKLSDYSIKFEDKDFWFNGKEHSITISGDLPEGVEVVYSGNGEYEIGKYFVTATFIVNNPNYESMEPMSAVMRVRLNWIPIVILMAIVFIILIVVIVIVEKMLKKQKNENKPPEDPDQKDDTQKEGANND